MTSATRRALYALVLPFVASCTAAIGGSPDNNDTGADTMPTPPPGFTFSTTEPEDLTVSVSVNGVPAQGVVVQVVSPLGANEDISDPAQVFFVGATSASGSVEGEIVIPEEYTEVDLVVHRAGTSGPYTDESQRAALGPVAPSSRTRVSRSALGFQFVALTNNS